jgi:aspartyl-tRNA(Asn)/glutamyl-tRNA(Gln) amidotransferase subunit A
MFDSPAMTFESLYLTLISALSNPLSGREFAIKDNICTVDFPTTCASHVLRDFRSPYDATVVQKLRDKGAVICGKTNMDEFGMGSHSTHSVFGAVHHISDGEALSAGGSSGGSAMAVATGQCWAWVSQRIETTLKLIRS